MEGFRQLSLSAPVEQVRPVERVAHDSEINQRGLANLAFAAGSPGGPETQTERDWRHGAVCRDEDPELFFPVGKTDLAVQQTGEAKAVCRRCPVAAACLAWALRTNQEVGVWGGMSEDERRSLKRRQARQRTRSAGF